MVEDGERTYELSSKTDLWTGDAKGEPNRLIATGLLGSIRWWFEVLVRGLKGNACDPTRTQCEGRNHCVVCELFGCTGWARKFRFEVLDKDGNVQAAQIEKDHNFGLRFTPLRPILDEEWALLDATLRLIAGYGAIGGKTVFKPTDEESRTEKLHHQDFGLVQMSSSRQFAEIRRNDLETYLSQWKRLNHGEFAWASLRHFWCVNGQTLTRQDNNTSSSNRVIKRPEPKQKSSQNDSWLAGYRPNPRMKIEAESKKVFSFKDPARTFGFVKPALIEFEEMRERLIGVWGQDGWKFITGDAILKELFRKGEEQA